MIKTIHNKIYLVSKACGKKIGLDLPYFIKNGFWVAVRQGIGAISGLALSVAFARLASQEVFGQYQFILSILSIVSILSIPGLNNSITRSVARGYDGDYKKVVRTSFFWSLLGIPVMLIIGGYYYVYQDHYLGIALMISSIFFPFFYAPNTWDSFLQGKGLFNVSARYASIQSIVNALVTILIIFLNKGNLISVIIIYLFSYTFFNGFYYIKSLQFITNNNHDVDGTIKYGWFLTKIGILNIIASNIDKIIVGIFLSQSQLAVYAVGIILPKQFQNITKSLFVITIPKQIKQKKISMQNYFKIFIISVLISVLMLLALPLMMNLLFSNKYQESIIIAKIAFLFYPFFAISLLYANKFMLNKKEGNMKIQYISTSIIRIAAMFIVIPFFGIYGVAFIFGAQGIITIIVLYLSENLNFNKKSLC